MPSLVGSEMCIRDRYGTARFATEKEIRETYVRVAYEPEKWRRGENLPKAQGLVVGWRRTGGKIDALIDSGGGLIHL